MAFLTSAMASSHCVCVCGGGGGGFMLLCMMCVHVCTLYMLTSMLGLYPSSKVAMAANEPESERQKVYQLMVLQFSNYQGPTHGDVGQLVCAPMGMYCEQTGASRVVPSQHQVGPYLTLVPEEGGVLLNLAGN